MERLRKFLNFVHAIVTVFESIFADILTILIPLLAPLVTAFMVWQNVIRWLHFPPFWSTLTAVVVEFLGFTAILTAFQHWDYNQRKLKSDARAPVEYAIGVAVYYFIAVIVINVLLELMGESVIVQSIVRGLLTTLSPIGALLWALRSQQDRRIAQSEVDKADRRKARQESKQQASKAYTEEKVVAAPPKKYDWRTMTPEERTWARSEPDKEKVAQHFGVTVRTVENWLRQPMPANGNEQVNA